MTQTLTLHLERKDERNSRRKENEKKPAVKLRPAQKQIELTNLLLQMEMKDREKGAMYGTGMAVSTIIVPAEVRRKENELKTLLCCDCDLLGCYANGHKTKKSKKCKYYTLSQTAQDEEMEQFLRYKYPQHYEGTKHLLVFTLCLNVCFIS